MSFVYMQKVLFKYCDPAGIVFFPRYFEMINDCVESFFDLDLDHSFERILVEYGVPTAEISARFLAPSRHGDLLQLHLHCERVGRSSLTLRIQGICGEQSRFVANSTLVFVDRNGRPHAWPDALKAKLLNHVGDAET